jgi:hypothetical protein
VENALYYTFSTIAQALGGAIALLSAFVLYRLTSFDSAMWKDAGDLTGAYPSATQQLQHEQMRAIGNWYQILLDVQAQANESHQHHLSHPYGPNGIGPYMRLSTNLLHRNATTVRFKRAALATGLIMLASVGFIPFAHMIACFRTLGWVILLGPGVAGFAWCLWLYWRVISLALGFSELTAREVTLNPRHASQRASLMKHLRSVLARWR